MRCTDNAVHILLIEDQPELAKRIAEELRGDGYVCEVAASGDAGVARLRAGAMDLVVLDLMPPCETPVQVLRALRLEGHQLPALLLGSCNSVADRVAALDAGADDYLGKPFAFQELEARIRALLRRGSALPAARLQLADLTLNVASRTAHRGAEALELTEREFNLLQYLLVHRGTVVSREMLARDVWQETTRFSSLNNVIDQQIARIRRKLDGPYRRRLLHTVRGVGFVLREQTG